MANQWLTPWLLPSKLPGKLMANRMASHSSRASARAFPTRPDRTYAPLGSSRPIPNPLVTGSLVMHRPAVQTRAR